MLLLWGAGGHGRVVLDVARAAGVHRIAFVDGNPALAGRLLDGCRVHPPEDLRALLADGYRDVLACVGDNRARARCFASAVAAGLRPFTAVHPSAIVSPSASVGAGTVLMPGAVINAGAAIGENCIVNTGAIVEHDCRVGAHAHISPGAALGGGAQVGELTHIGLRAVLLPLAAVGRDAVVGAGAVVLRQLPDGVVAVGVPARVIRHRSAAGSSARS